ncbi:nickel ABC transporter permease [Alkalihalobacillus alcalophilus ATCC 27647 = CGMCC 1.3604]|uniref:Dipeptide/oligopeptide transporter n=1 Tax=Alkalihalobacillus alcalophilus ATCC 27647 = CGMCC 1.3604 TaxID=1218173 RepID=J8TUM0_ALKAL|nr:nickel transporter permease [Alkalihalobacillus alcalophilus]AFV25702.1 dipeptide/oligopeptide transporter [Alkalihalobacillus alcalophilus ATCC 27647 = CGMCC 1.3604]KGA99062.1 nickel transporter permease NikC [Alkalihalobacillus alcalophilus ATCC 27647 = CGMCC 1.3604]MED1560707.1 ABC transporter permease subunit [Alkalihalobacillus alcalophilus]THG88557.1 nickel ABC transporter permease [Alkalihalobacillus alcalophilus ATCC 27647 = CGMCC 1.3604]
MKRKVVIGFFIGTSLLLICLPYLAPNDPLKVDMSARLLNSSHENLLGTDHLGRDLLSRILAGAQMTVGTTFIILLISLLIGIPLGLIAGFRGGLVDKVIMRTVDALLAFPDFIIAIVICGILGPGMMNLIIAIVFVRWISYARIIRGTVLSIKQTDYIAMAQINGLSTFSILRKHVFPHIIGTTVVYASLDIGKIILLIATLSYIGLGVQPPYAEWGSMLNEANAYFYIAPQLMVYPGIAIVIIVLIYNLIGDALRDSYDVRKSEVSS